MITVLRIYAYLVPGPAIACFFLFPEPNAATIGALLMQTLAFIMIAGRPAAGTQAHPARLLILR